ncbi:homing endonuclease [Proteus phage phiP4-3]|uniref:I-Tevl homing endonuclease n=1 Tax=Proteus phage phiP4-3 TaxID=2065203 RepID=A0A2I6PF91_9CAUD|nr:homing endonuclease [Proteus phage phiP4-3]AUM58390.1 I-Tevl homing endonuclease [Proteus phage phiP4-3]
MKGGIYKIENLVNNKVYIGSAKDFNIRWKRHLSDLRKNRHSSIKLQRAYNKYGKDNFRFSIIEYSKYTPNIKNLEQFYIELYNSKILGYNIADASFGDVMSQHPNKEFIIKKISTSLKTRISKMSNEERKIKYGRYGTSNGRYNPEKHKAFKCIICSNPISYKSSIGKGLCNLCLKKGQSNPFYGKRHSEKTKNILKGLLKGNTNRNKRIIVNDKEYSSCKECAEDHKISCSLVTYRLKSDKYPSWLYLNA